MSTSIVNVIRILLIDDHVVVRAGMRMLIESWPGLQVAGEASSRAEALALMLRDQPDIILLDTHLDGASSLDLLPELLAIAAGARVILLAGARDGELHRRAVQLGAMGIVLKDQAADVLFKAIEKVHAGEVWLAPAMVASMLAELMQSREAAPADPEAARIATLTDREREVIGLVCEGLQNKQIAVRLCISETTVRHHLTSIFDKVGVTNRLELVIFAYRSRLASLHG